MNKYKHLIRKFPRLTFLMKTIYKKCQSNFYITIPKGLKYFVSLNIITINLLVFYYK